MLKKILLKNDWKEEEASLCPQMVDLFPGTYLQTLFFYGHALSSVCIYAHEGNNYGYEWVLKDELKQYLEKYLAVHSRDGQFFREKLRQIALRRDQIREVAYAIRGGVLTTLKKEDIAKLYETIIRLGSEQYGLSIMAEVCDVIEGQRLIDALSGAPTKDWHRILEQLTTSDCMTVSRRQEEGLARLLAGLQKKSPLAYKNVVSLGWKDWKKQYPEALEQLYRHREKYFWMQNNFFGAKDLSAGYFYGEMQRIFQAGGLKKVRKTNALANIHCLEKQYGIDVKSQSLFDFVRVCSAMQDVRKEAVQLQVYAVQEILSWIQKEYGVSLEELRLYLAEDITNMLLRGKVLSRAMFEKRRCMIFYADLNERGEIQVHYLYGRRAREVLHIFEKKRLSGEHAEMLSGQVASVGGKKKTVTGRVRIVMDAMQTGFTKGEILVTGMTRPEFVPLMKMARAIVTNEGGITTHAAIISRELKKPCIVGTKIATRVLKDGDLVEVDANQGIVKILRREKS